MNLVEEKQRGLIPLGLKSWQLQLIEHLTNTTSVEPPPAGLAGCRPLYILHLLNLSFTYWTPIRCCILQCKAYQSLICNFPVILGAKARFLRRKSKVVLDEISEIKTNEPVHEISNNLVCATSKSSDQPAQTRRLIRAFACRLNIL